MESSDPNEVGISLTEAINRRLKSRERQRRYRDKKRRRTESSNVNMSNQSSQTQIIVLPTDVPVVQTVTRVYCKRDWKKEARRVHALNQEAVSNGIASTGQLPFHTTEKDQTLKSGVPSAYVGTTENVRRKLCRRDWKAEARSKTN
ncbi:hypothetical protein vseg_006454 [Gypsophila vaccaria]